MFKLAPFLITIMTTAGILSHEMHIDRATTMAMTVSIAAISVAALDTFITQNHHTHVERASLPKFSTSMRSSLPNTQPPRDDDRKYVQNRKLMFMGGGDAASLWPSV